MGCADDGEGLVEVSLVGATEEFGSAHVDQFGEALWIL